MTNEEALKILKRDIDGEDVIECGVSFVNALKIAIKALEQQQNIHDTCKKCVEFSEFENQPCEDAISREAVLDMMQMRMGGKELYMAVYELPSVTPQRKNGKWIEYCYQNYECSECGFIIADSDVDEYKYCPNCGTKMEVE